jgi:hypothetical protein
MVERDGTDASLDMEKMVSQDRGELMDVVSLHQFRGTSAALEFLQWRVRIT